MRYWGGFNWTSLCMWLGNSSSPKESQRPQVWAKNTQIVKKWGALSLSAKSFGQLVCEIKWWNWLSAFAVFAVFVLLIDFFFYIIWHWFWLVFGSSRGVQSIVGFGIYRESVWLELKKANYSDLWSLPGLAHVPKKTFWTLTHNIYRHKSSRKYFNNYLKISLK